MKYALSLLQIQEILLHCRIHFINLRLTIFYHRGGNFLRDATNAPLRSKPEFRSAQSTPFAAVVAHATADQARAASG
jgi:hypothetical protein